MGGGEEMGVSVNSIPLNEVIHDLCDTTQKTNLLKRFEANAQRCNCSVGALASAIRKGYPDFLLPDAVLLAADEYDSALPVSLEPDYITECRNTPDIIRASTFKAVADKHNIKATFLADELIRYGLELLLPKRYTKEARAKYIENGKVRKHIPVPEAELQSKKAESKYLSVPELYCLFPNLEKMENAILSVNGKGVTGVRMVSESYASGSDRIVSVELITE